MGSASRPSSPEAMHRAGLQDRLLRWAPVLLASRPYPIGEKAASAPFDRAQITPTAWFNPHCLASDRETVTLAEIFAALVGSPEAAAPILEQADTSPDGSWVDLDLPRPDHPAAEPIRVGAFHRLVPAGPELQILLAWYGQRLPQLEDECHRLQADLEQARRVLSTLETSFRLERGRVETLLEAAAGPVSIQDTGYRILAQNAAHRQMFGDRRGESCHQVYRERSEPCAGCPMPAAFESREPAVLEDRPDQGPLAGAAVHIRALPLFGSDHSPGGMVETFSRPDTAAVERDVQVVSPTTRLRDHEMHHILGVLERSGGNRAQAARMLGISRATLWRRLGPQPPRRDRSSD